jgi:hypothetical protein
MKLLMGRIETFAAPGWSKAPIQPRDAIVRFFISLPLAFFAKTSRLFEITKVPCFAGFLSTGRVWGSSRGFEPLGDAIGPLSDCGHSKFVSESFLGGVDYRKVLDGQPKNPGQHAHRISWGDGLLPRVMALRNAYVWSTSEMHPISEPQIRHCGNSADGLA